MFSKLREFISRHKKKFIVGTIVVAGGCAFSYAQRKLLEYQEKQVKEFLEKTRRIQHFESTEKTTDQAIFTLLNGLVETINNKALDTNIILTELRSSDGSKKIELWEELKIIAFARTTALVYATSLLVCSLRIHLNVIGGYLYKENQQSTDKITKEVQTIFSLVLIQHLMSFGLSQLIDIIHENVKSVMKNHSLKEKMALSDIEQVFWSIQNAVDKGIDKNLIQFILPAETHRNQQDEILNKMLADSMDVLECGEFIESYESSVNNGFSVVIDKIADFYSEPVQNGKNTLNQTQPSSSAAFIEKNIRSNQNDGYVNINNISMPLAKLIPILNALTSQIPLNNANENKKNLASLLVVLQIQNQNLKNLGANVYEVYSN